MEGTERQQEPACEELPCLVVRGAPGWLEKGRQEEEASWMAIKEEPASACGGQEGAATLGEPPSLVVKEEPSSWKFPSLVVKEEPSSLRFPCLEIKQELEALNDGQGLVAGSIPSVTVKEEPWMSDGQVAGASGDQGLDIKDEPVRVAESDEEWTPPVCYETGKPLLQAGIKIGTNNDKK